VVASISGTLNFNLAAHYGIKGAVTGFSSACASSAHALAYAYDEIALGRQKRMLVVGGEDDSWESLLPFSGMRALSRQENPALASRPFDQERDGFVGAGGGVVLILEAADFAKARGAPIAAELGGWAQSADGHKIAQSDPEGESLLAALRRALDAAHLAPAQIDYVNAHATSTLVGDRAEARALYRLFGDQCPPVSSTKALTGHPLSMSGVMEAAFCVLAIQEGFIPGNAHTLNPEPACAVINLPRENLDRAPRHVLSNSCGFGGSNVVLVLSRWEG
jgi:3-oxoacyl-(acyl-carrier-protein) synthase